MTSHPQERMNRDVARVRFHHVHLFLMAMKAFPADCSLLSQESRIFLLVVKAIGQVMGLRLVLLPRPVEHERVREEG